MTTEIEIPKYLKDWPLLRFSPDRHTKIKLLSELTGVPIRKLTDRALDAFLAAHKDQFGRTESEVA